MQTFKGFGIALDSVCKTQGKHQKNKEKQ